jgi:hypothetical protein
VIGFIQGLFQLPKTWLVWVGGLFSVNLAAVFFLPKIEAIVVLACLMLGGLIQSAIFESKGFVRLLGIGHILWIPMIAWLLIRFEFTSPKGMFEIWMAVVVIFDSLSLLIDTTDVVRYWLGDRQPHI